jgi:hypothetical protein
VSEVAGDYYELMAVPSALLRRHKDEVVMGEIHEGVMILKIAEAKLIESAIFLISKYGGQLPLNGQIESEFERSVAIYKEALEAIGRKEPRGE